MSQESIGLWLMGESEPVKAFYFRGSDIEEED